MTYYTYAIKSINKIGFWGVAEGFFKNGLYNNTVFRNTIKNFLGDDPKFNRKTEIAITNYDSGQPEFFNETTHLDEMINVLHASSSAAGAFPYVNINGNNYGDGSITLLIDIGSAVHRCREIVDSDSKIFIDV